VKCVDILRNTGGEVATEWKKEFLIATMWRISSLVSSTTKATKGNFHSIGLKISRNFKELKYLK